jgi:hypothetical protein
MISDELPQISSCVTTSNSLNVNDMNVQRNLVYGGPFAGAQEEIGQALNFAQLNQVRSIQREQPKRKEAKMADKRRIVRVIISDPDPKVPLSKTVLFDADEQVTDLTDQELFFNLNIGELLKAHNEFRIGVEYESGEKKKKLEPIRIRDLRMSVLTIAEL